MGSSWKATFSIVLLYLFVSKCCGSEYGGSQMGTLRVDASESSGQLIPQTFFGIFFEAGGPNIPSNIAPWGIIGKESSVIVSTDRSSCFERNKIALKMEVLCDSKGANSCPSEGVGIYNPGFWGMNIEQGKQYKVALYVRSSGSINVSIELKASNWLQKLAATNIIASASEVSDWKKIEVVLEAKGSDSNSSLHLTTTSKGVIWFDQVSVMPLDTYKGHGFRTDLIEMMADLKPRFFRFPGGCFVEGEWLRNAFRWKETIGPWEERPGHFGDVWMYWTDDGMGYFEFLQLAEDLGTLPIWVFNNGISHQDEVDTSSEALDGIEFARGEANSTWGAVRFAMGHPEPFDLRYLDHPADLYDYHVYTSSSDMFSRGRHFDSASRSGPKAFVSEYAVTGKDAGQGSFLAALGEAGFLIGLEKNSDAIDMVSYAPLFVNTNDRRFFTESSGATLHKTTLQMNSYNSIAESAISWKSSEDDKTYLRIKIVNYGAETVNIIISVDGLDPNSVKLSGSTKTVLTSKNLMDENSFKEPNKIVPTQSLLETDGGDMEVVLPPHSITSFDLLKETSSIKIAGADSIARSSM
ncbi:hypothetical protein F8388_026367 [Cannabis sativa]|uniref:non-reducing end alpha-L-arabinofuranosidase n=1 Tax=Cannabis sativa TaxID=3483 RepID=A0A7J6E341_CANSA|nr:hypothetical protein F8388_026367 [Cannabis sativa]KAF4390185.1 hypothetical protein G4B88_005103 [Cannabis sativa]